MIPSSSSSSFSSSHHSTFYLQFSENLNAIYVFHLFFRNWPNIINACFRPPLHYYFNFHCSFGSNIQLHLLFPSFTYHYRTIYLHHISDVYLFTVDWEILSVIRLYIVLLLSFVYQILCFFHESWFLLM